MSRHAMPIDVRDYVFPTIVENIMNFKNLSERAEKELNSILFKYGYMNFSNDGYKPSKEIELHLYVTGLTPCIIAVVNYCLKYKVKLVCYHYDTDIQDYRPQYVYIRGTEND